ncbi:hypothetical protein RR48_09319 [Papilio machaon]|uniref:Uncharacterized protein n=1 Tax=Papilio machaon TaxID=76193 RepID=A0A194RCG5_PAPMA|nr:hypothetical protein RR48_09319 [Papilio machaon]
MKIKVVALLLLVLTTQCQGQFGSIGNFLSNTFNGINNKVKEVAGVIIGGISSTLKLNPHDDKKQPSDGTSVAPEITSVAPSSIAGDLNGQKNENKDDKVTENPVEVRPTFVPLDMSTTEEDFPIDVHSQNPNQKAAAEPPQRSASQKIADEQGSNNFNQNLNLNDNTGDVNLQSTGTANKQNYGNYTSRT